MLGNKNIQELLGKGFHRSSCGADQSLKQKEGQGDDVKERRIKERGRG
jgi:hypothetical protein